MQIYRVIAEPLDPTQLPASAYVVAEHEDEALLLLRKDFNFTGYRLPPREMTVAEPSRAEIRRVLGPAARREKGVYGFMPAGSPILS